MVDVIIPISAAYDTRKESMRQEEPVLWYKIQNEQLLVTFRHESFPIRATCSSPNGKHPMFPVAVKRKQGVKFWEILASLNTASLELVGILCDVLASGYLRM